ncbi:5-methylcytosine rRNA methyltransferase NSUN4 [Frieseomelitta varia]|uniref:5-methylcytosine rRNA methyltransferase NSUN4 n=1 Tax=Frieseomelitta varia TaxID=561572 RepID=UPI001CB6A755|nr:5-methylcytosine rRNA methyltransferase NSUN4 [Frieseomelitta varia]
MAVLLNMLTLKQIVHVSARYAHKKIHWAKLKKLKTVRDKALEHFDEFYANVYGKKWPDIRAALLKEETKYMAVVNNFSDPDRVKSELELLGAINLRTLYNVHKENLDFFEAKRKAESQDEQNLEQVTTSEDQLAELQTIHPANRPNLFEALNAESTEFVNNDRQKHIELKSIDENLNEVELDTNRIVNSSLDLSMLQEYIPTTKIKGLDDWVLESDHYKFYDKASDFRINVEKESVLSFPEHLYVYTFERENYTRFPNPKKGSTGVSDYYLFDGGSILPVLALDIQFNDMVLDMCAAPGGKALTIFQTLMPRVLVANDVGQSRINRLKNVMNEYVSNICEGQNMLIITQQDGRSIDENGRYNKILVDVPCTTDRHMLHSDDNNIFKPSRTKERLKMPEIQAEILTTALKLVSVGGTVVYSTCALSPVQNDGVVQVALKRAWEENNCVMVVKDMTEALLPLQCIYNFGNIDLKYGHIVIPTLQNNWGPMYFCKMEKVQ